MAQSHPALWTIRRFLEKCQRGSHSEHRLPTPTLSLRERENPSLTFGTTQRGVWPNEPPAVMPCPETYRRILSTRRSRQTAKTKRHFNEEDLIHRRNRLAGRIASRGGVQSQG